MYIIQLMSNDGVTDAIRKLGVGDGTVLRDIERPNIHAIATRVRRKVKAKKQDDGSFLVKCVEIVEDK